jgi:hypothetical protein
VIIESLLLLAGVIVFMYVFWKRLREDYSADNIFSTAFYIMLLSIIFAFVTSFIIGNYWFYGGVFGAFTGIVAGYFVFKYRIYEVMEGVVIAFLYSLVILFLYDALIILNRYSLIFVGLCILLIVLFGYIDRRYKGYTWYKSGRVGFTGLTVLGLFFVVRSAIALSSFDMISFGGSADVYLSTLLSFMSLIAVVNLSRT